MRIPHIYTPQTLTCPGQISLDERSVQHLVKVLRMNRGDHVVLFNGDGHFYTGQLADVTKKSATVELTACAMAQSESALNTHLGQVISRGDRMDYAIQKSTELGVTEITPLLSERCEVKLSSERQAKRQLHWQQVAISAAEQCGRAVVPTVHSVQTLEHWIAQRPKDALSLVLHHRHSQALNSFSPPSRVNLLIGPEGGLSEVEIDGAEKAGFIATTLGPRVFRTETAPVAVLSTIQWLWGDFQGSTHSHSHSPPDQGSPS